MWDLPLAVSFKTGDMVGKYLQKRYYLKYRFVKALKNKMTVKERKTFLFPDFLSWENKIKKNIFP